MSSCRPAGMRPPHGGSSPARYASDRVRSKSSPTGRRHTRKLSTRWLRRRGMSPSPCEQSIEADHGRLKARLRPMRGLKRLATARTVAAGHAFVQNLRRGHYEISAELPVQDWIRVAFDELALVL